MALASKAFSDLITFTRASTAGYYGSDGLYKTAASGVARTGTYADYKPADITQQNILTYSSGFDNAAWTKANSFVQTNLLTYSQDFDNVAGWAKNTSTVIANTAIAPDGTLTADKLISNAGVFGNVSQAPTVVVSTTYTYSVYAKAAEFSWLRLQVNLITGTRVAWFNLASGAVGTVQSGLTASIVSAGNGFYRCIVAATADNTTGSVLLYATTADNSNTNGDGTSGIYLWGAQLVQGSVAGDYRATTSAALPILYSDPLGTTLAMKLCETTATGFHYIFQGAALLTAGGTLSVYAKAGERTMLGIYRNANSTGATFNLSTGLVDRVNSSLANATTFTSGDWTATISAIGSGWYRCTLSISAASTQTGNYYFAADTSYQSNYAGNGSSGIYLFGAQQNEGTTALPYIASTAGGAHATVIGTKRGFLVEDSRTNLLLYSNDWSQTQWAKTNITRTGAAAIGPDGTMSMTKLEATASVATSATQSFVSTATSLVYSIYVKQGSGAADANLFYLRNFTTSTNVVGLSINYSTGVISQSVGTGATAEPIGNGIWRISMPATSGITIGDSMIAYAGFIGNNETAGEYCYVYGAQVEAGDKATTYIPTTTAQVTRAADSARVNTLTPWFSTTGGTFYAEGTNGNYPATLLSMLDAAGYATNSVAVGKISTSPFRWSEGAAYNTGGNASLQFDTTAASVLKFAFSWDGTNIYAAANGQTTKTAVRALSLANTSGGVRLGEYFFGNMLNNHLRVVRFYPRVFVGTELSALTA